MFAVIYYDAFVDVCCKLTPILSCSLPEEAEVCAVFALPDFKVKALTRHASHESIEQLLATSWSASERHFCVGRKAPHCDECPTTVLPSGKTVEVALTRYLPPFGNIFNPTLRGDLT